MLISVVATAAALPLLIIYVAEKIKRFSLKGVFLKTAVSLLFILTAIGGGISSGSTVYPYLVIAGLVFGMTGDIWLDLKYVFPEKDIPFTYAGFTVFGIGHVFFVAAMLSAFGGPDDSLLCALPVAAAVLITIAVLAMEKPMKLRYGSFRPVVAAYSMLLFSTALWAGFLIFCSAGDQPALWFMLAGGISFALSDLVLSGTYFGKDHDKPADIILNYIFYYLGQFLIAWSVMFV